MPEQTDVVTYAKGASSFITLLYRCLGSQRAIAIGNPLLFQCNWFVCVFAPTTIAIISTVCLLIYHFCFVSRQFQEWRIMLLFAFVGFFFDSLLAQLQWLSFNHALVFPLSVGELTLAPVWLLLLWLSFSTCLNHALRYLHQRWWLSALLVIVAIPFNYALGASLTGSEFIQPMFWVLAVITAYWLVLLLTALTNCARLVHPR